jgi:hypothetical protein
MTSGAVSAGEVVLTGSIPAGSMLTGTPELRILIPILLLSTNFRTG